MDQDLKLYHHTDDDAPPLDGEETSKRERRRVEALHQILVTGYGDQAAAGWEEISKSYDEDGHMIHFTARQPWGNGIYVRIERGKDIVAARDVENDGQEEDDLLDTFRAGLDGDEGHTPPCDETPAWFALANERTFYFVYDRAGEPATGDPEKAACIVEGFVTLDDLHGHRDASTGHLVAGASRTTQLLARYDAATTSEPTREGHSIAIEGTPSERAPHYAALRAPLARRGTFGSDAAREARWSEATTLDNRIILDRLMVEDGAGNFRGYLPSVRFMLTGFVREADSYSADQYPGLGDKVVIDGAEYRFAYPGENSDTVGAAPNTALLLFKEGD